MTNKNVLGNTFLITDKWYVWKVNISPNVQRRMREEYRTDNRQLFLNFNDGRCKRGGRETQTEKIPGPADRRRTPSECKESRSINHCIQNALGATNMWRVKRGTREHSWCITLRSTCLVETWEVQHSAISTTSMSLGSLDGLQELIDKYPEKTMYLYKLCVVRLLERKWPRAPSIPLERKNYS